MKRWFLAAAYLLSFGAIAFGQWQVPSGSVPVGRGSGVIGFSDGGPQSSYSAKGFGATGNGSTDDTSAMRTWALACEVTKIPCFIDGGNYRTTGSISITSDITISGAGRTISVIQPSTDGQTGLSFNTTGVVHLSNFQLATNASNVTLIAWGPGGAGITQWATFRDLWLQGGLNQMDMNGAAYTIDNVLFASPTNIGLLIRDINNPDAGDMVVSNSYFTGQAGIGTAILQQSAGGLKLLGNKFIQWANGYVLQLASGVSTSDLFMTANSFESFTGAAIKFTNSGSVFFGTIALSGNEFNGCAICVDLSDPSTNWINNFTIEGGTVAPLDNGSGINIATAGYFSIGPLIVQRGGSGAGTTGIIIGASAGPGVISQGVIYNGVTTNVINSSNTVIDYSAGLNGVVGTREMLRGPRIYFVRSDGGDGCTGLTNTAGSSGNCAFATTQKAVNTYTNTLDFAGQTVTVQVNDQTTTSCVSITQPWTGGGSVVIQGNSTTPANVFFNCSSYAFQVATNLPGSLTIKNLKCASTNASCIYLTGTGTINYSGIVYGSVSASAGIHAGAAISGALVQASGAYSIVGGAAVHMYGQSGGFSFNRGVPVFIVLPSPPVFSDFSFATTLSNAASQSATFLGAAAPQQLFTANTHTNTTLDSISINTSSLSVGMTVAGSGIPTGTTISSITNATTVVLSQATTATTTGVSVAYGYRRQGDAGDGTGVVTANTHTNTTLDNISVNTNLLMVGMSVNGSGIPTGTTISSITNSTTVVLSQAATTTVTGGSIKFELATGAKYSADGNSIIGTGQKTNFLPGNAAGSLSTGGQYLWLLKRDLKPANDNTPMWLNEVA